MSETFIIATSLVSLFSGFLLGIYSIRGYVIPPSVTAKRQAALRDPVESDESDVDEDDSILDHAPNWKNGVEADHRDGLRARSGTVTSAVGSGDLSDTSEVGRVLRERPGEECKLVLVVRTDLGMTKGKIAAQASHATLACYKSLSRQSLTSPSSSAAQILRRWERAGQAKIAVQTKSQDELLTLQATARSLGLAAEVIADAGRTQIEAGSLTVLGVGPAPKTLVDQVTGRLKLL